MNFLKKYLNLMKLRYTDKVTVNLDLPILTIRETSPSCHRSCSSPLSRTPSSTG